MVIIADNDEGGIGQTKTEQACALTGATYALPPQVGMDANDWIKAGGSIEDYRTQARSMAWENNLRRLDKPSLRRSNG